LSLVGLGLSAVMILYTLIILISYQGKSQIPQALLAYTDCTKVPSTSWANLKAGAQFGSLMGPAPRRPWLCKADWSYYSALRTAANLVYGGAVTSFIGYISLLIGFAYLVQPFVVPVGPSFAKAAAPASTSYRGTDVDWDDYTDDYYTEYDN